MIIKDILYGEFQVEDIFEILIKKRPLFPSGLFVYSFHSSHQALNGPV